MKPYQWVLTLDAMMPPQEHRAGSKAKLRKYLIWLIIHIQKAEAVVGEQAYFRPEEEQEDNICCDHRGSACGSHPSLSAWLISEPPGSHASSVWVYESIT